MKTTHKIIFVLFLNFWFSMHLIGQSYETALGIRFNEPSGIGVTFQYAPFREQRISFESIVLSDFNKYSRLSLLAEEHRRFLGKRVNFYYGLGPQYAFNQNFGNSFGVALAIGFEVTFFGLNASWDYLPVYNLTGGNQKLNHTTGISIRRVLSKHKKNWKFWEKW